MARILVLGGTDLANAFVTALRVAHPDLEIVLSLAGRTRNPKLPDCVIRTGGFGGTEGLAAYLREEGITALVDATHPYAAQISANAAKAASETGTPSLHLVRPAWEQASGDNWHHAQDYEEAARHLDALSQTHPLTVFLTVGRQELKPFHSLMNCTHVARSVEQPDAAELPPGARVVLARGPFREEHEMAFLKDNAIDVIVSKNSGGTATYGKILAARSLRMPVVMVARPPLPEGEIVGYVESALTWVERIL
ncbi:cobalt-precorrin-6A reductase [Nisaea nitritireducens]|uniref:cobalt-precorrin-6A reductase n=1 Tax=Nisaea nitritireducens TaxID=568392 RepID=UPI00186682E3|nr:cobalt-precorrin-6A reductase [Nisaea nitritireducens]